VAVYIARWRIDKRPFKTLGLQAPAWGDLLYGFFTAGLMMGFIYLALQSLGWLEAGPTEAGSGAANLGITALLLAAFILVGFYEELLARGYWLQNLEEGLNTPWAVVISSIIFSLGHITNPSYLWPAMLGLLLSGLFLAYAYLRTRRLWLPIGLHIGWNFFEGVVFGFPVSGVNIPRLLTPRITGPEMWTGGAFGPEAGLILLPALVLGAFLVYWFTRGREVHRPETAPPQ